MELIDVGCNLAHSSFNRDRAEVIRRAREQGVVQIVCTGTSEAASRRAAELAATRPRELYATAGVHPHDARQWNDGSAGALAELAGRPEVVAIGEAGLDFNRDYSPRPDQERALEAQMELAAALGMPLFLHERDAHERMLALLRRHRHRVPAAVVHCFTGDERALEAYLDLDLHVGITGWICDERRGAHLAEIVGRVPLERLMVETDAPFLLPRDLAPRPRDRRNEPMHLRHVAATVARAMGIEPGALARATTATARAFFGLAGPA